MTTRHDEGPVALSGRVVRLREFTLDDLDGVRGIVGDDRVTHFLSFNTRTDEQAHELLRMIVERARERPRSEYYLAITPLEPETPADRDKAVGFTRLHRTNEYSGRLVYAVAYDHQGRGYAGDAVRTVLDFAFTTLGLHRVTAAVGPDNRAGMALVKNLGFTREGVLRDHVHTNGAWRDSVLFSMLAPEWRTARET
ncbi:GNAT family N-acetyltransferase [Saccharomonospora glauca]|uniref:Acetyltransferase, ribosomal protein N-acetylase n=1 Tax=Saccharomonospora glauca K62 TaxID=928724 RepID=I1CWN6_9PSEU|nr:GNAT family protein [Saccharomonospora glauca]EIE97110.1 acetyltransferase, ribosomal protein N-acetylase [Saccharomonospora glauca K62]